MSNPEPSLAMRSANARRDYWMEQLEAAKREGSIDAAINAQRFIDEYDQLIVLMHQSESSAAEVIPLQAVGDKS